MVKESEKKTQRENWILQKKVVKMQLSVFEIITVTKNISKQK